MAVYEGLVQALVDELGRLPGIGPKSAQRIAFYLLKTPAEDANRLAKSITEAKARVTPSDVELANQITYYARPCAAVQRAADSARADSIDKVMKAARTDSIARAGPAAKAENKAKTKAKALPKTKTLPKTNAKAPLKKEAPKAAAPETKGPGWSAQVAAYDSPEDAQRLAKKLSDRGYEARVTNEKPFRVRIGRYARRAEAVDLAAKLKDAKITAIVVEAEKP